MPKYRQVIAGIVNSPLGKQIIKSNESSSDFLRGALDTASLGATRALDKSLASSPMLDQKSREIIQEGSERAQNSTSGKVGEFAGYLVPGAAADRLVVAAGGAALKRIPKLAEGLIRGATAGTIDTAAQEVGDVAFREG